jgi:hypothetical protein
VIEVLANDVTLEGMRRVKVVSDEPLEGITIDCILPGAHLSVWKDELLGLHYLEAIWTCREAIQIQLEGWTCPREMVLWKLLPGERVSEVLKEMVRLFGARFQSFPDYAFMRKLPKTIENGFEVNDVTLLEAEWVPAGCIAVGKGEQYGLEAMAMQE